MRAAGISEIGDAVLLLELPGPRALRPDEVLIDVRACGIGNWDEIARQGGWSLGTRPPMALGVEAAGLVAAVGDQVARVGALTADQTIGDALGVRAGETILVHGAGGVTGGMLVALAAHRGATVIATAGPDSASRVAALGAEFVLDYHQPDWPEQARALAQGGVDAAANAVPAGSIQALRAVRDRGRLATITSDPPAPERDITVRAVLVAPDGRRLGRLVQFLAEGVLTVLVGERFPLEQGAAALARVGHGAPGSAVVLQP